MARTGGGGIRLFVVVLLVSFTVLLLTCRASPNTTSDAPSEAPSDAPSTYERVDESLEWTNFGGNLKNQRFNSQEKTISVLTAPSLAVKWSFTAPGDLADISATPALFNGAIYFPSWNGNVYALDAKTGVTLWEQNITDLLAPAGVSAQEGEKCLLSRATTVVAPSEGLLLVSVKGPAYILALSLERGDLVWFTLIDPWPFAIVTASGTVYEGAYYVGVSSTEETYKGIKENTYTCCVFIGSLVKLDLSSGTILWRTLMAPYNTGRNDLYSGNAVWGSGPAIDTTRRLVIIGTGNNYNVPKSIQRCQARVNSLQKLGPRNPCLRNGNWGNSIVALDLLSGFVVWGKQLDGYDVWNGGCGKVNRYVREYNTDGYVSPDALGNISNPVNPNCPMGPNVDYDFGQSPVLLTDERGRHLAVAGQKSGMVWALERSRGKVVWGTAAGPSGAPGGLRQSGGGLNWGSSTDGDRVYVSVVNGNNLNFTLLPSTEVVKKGGWVALNATTGEIIWSVANPRNETLPFSAAAAGATAVANGVLFVTSTDSRGYVYALEASTGKILFEHETGSGVYGGFAIGGGCAYIGLGTGNKHSSNPLRITPGNKLLAFCV